LCNYPQSTAKDYITIARDFFIGDAQMSTAMRQLQSSPDRLEESLYGTGDLDLKSVVLDAISSLPISHPYRELHYAMLVSTAPLKDKEKFFKAVKKMSPRTFFQIVRYRKELENKTVSDIVEEYGSNIPAGWIATYCTCGTFYPATGDINSELNDEAQLPVEISIEDIDTIDVMSDNVLHFNMISGEIFECAILSAMRTVSFLDILKQCS
jgi:hypothetical protein